MKLILPLILVYALNLSATDIPLNPAKTDPGMEVGQWSTEPWSNSGSVEKQSINDQKMMQVLYTGGKNDKAAFKHLTSFGLNPKGKIKLHVYTAEEKPPQVAIALSTTLAYKWHESKWRDLKKGWNALEFDVGTSDWKTEASGWKFSVSVEPPNDVRAVDFIVFNGDKTGVLYVQGWSYDADETGEKIKTFMQDIQSEDASKRELAEKALVAIGRPALEALHQIADNDRPEVLLRAASAIRQIEAIPEAKPADPTILEAIEKQKEEQSFDETRRRAEYTLRGIDTERQRIESLFKDAQEEVTAGKKQLADLKFTEDEKKKDFADTVEKLEKLLKEIEPLSKIDVPKKEVEPKKKK
ncbi:MAG TPA: hypothetical protein VKX17_03835 [Planctomycetota bacterium]|nr:hypothetical protein [Planctomycetota bacterium]